MTPEAAARHAIDAMLAQSGWIVQDKADMNLHAGPVVAVQGRDYSAAPAAARLGATTRRGAVRACVA